MTRPAMPPAPPPGAPAEPGRGAAAERDPELDRRLDGELDGELARLAAATDALGPRGGFRLRVMAAVRAEAELPRAFGLPLPTVTRASVRALVVAAVAAAVSLGFAVQSEQRANASLAAEYPARLADPLEVGLADAEGMVGW